MGKLDHPPAEAIFECRRCMAYLRAMYVKPPYTGLSDYCLACLIVDGAFDDDALAAEGMVNFDLQDGATLIHHMERLLRDGLKETDAGIGAAKAKLARLIRENPQLKQIKGSASFDEIEKIRSARGGFRYRDLAPLGVPVPPPKGWRQVLMLRRKLEMT